jgi:hypothetical protein
MAYVRPQHDDQGTLLVVDHYRHLVAGDRVCPHRTEDRDHKSPWHAGWQNTTSDPDRVEHRHTVGDRTRVADIWTRYGWAVEVQHSAIAKATVTGREDHYTGRVVWLVDAATESAPCHVDAWRDHRGQPAWRVHPIPPWMGWLRTVVTLDTGGMVLILPTGRPPLAWRAGGELLVPRHLAEALDRDTFTARWVNGDTLPLPAGVRTPWQQEHAQKSAQAARRAAPEQQAARAAARAERAARDAGTCRYDGPRERLLLADQPEPVIPAPRAPVEPITPRPATPDGCHRAGCDAPAYNPRGATPRDGWLGLLCPYHRGDAIAARALGVAL